MRKINFNGYLKDEYDGRDYMLLKILRRVSIPGSFIYSWPPVIYNQTGPSCVGFSGAGIKSDQEQVQFNVEHRFDGLRLYKACKKIDGAPDQEGTYPRVALKILKAVGINEVGKKKTLPWRIRTYARLGADTTATQLKQSIFQYGSIMMGTTWYNSWCELPENNFLPKPDEAVGGHAWSLIGWLDEDTFIGRNSWGPEWGGEGLFYIPRKMIPAMLKEGDAWTLVDLT